MLREKDGIDQENDELKRQIKRLTSGLQVIFYLIVMMSIYSYYIKIGVLYKIYLKQFISYIQYKLYVKYFIYCIYKFICCILHFYI